MVAEGETPVKLGPLHIPAQSRIFKIPFLLNNGTASGATFLFSPGQTVRKTRRETKNLLGGRALSVELFPLVSAELSDFDLER